MKITREPMTICALCLTLLAVAPAAGAPPDAGGAVTLHDAALAAASQALELERTVDATGWLEAVPPAERGWVWSWLAERSDRSAEVLLDAGAPLAAFAVSRDGRRFAAAAEDGRLLLRDDEGVKTVAGDEPEDEAEPDAAQGLAFAPDGSRLALARRSGEVTILDFETGATLGRWRVESAGLGAVAWSPAGDRIAVGGFRRDPETRRPVGFLELRSAAGEVLEEFPSSAFFVGALAFSTDGATLVAGGPQGRLDVIDVAGEEPPRALEITDSHGFPQVHDLAFSPDGDRLTAACDDGTLRHWSTATWEPVARPAGAPPEHRAAAFAVTYDRFGESLVSAGADLALRVRGAGDDPALARGPRSLLGHQAPVVALALDASGDPLSASADGTVRRWSPASEPQLRAGASVWGVGFRSDGARLATADAAGRIRVWDLATGATVQEVEAHDGDAVSVRFTKDGTRLVSTGNDGRLRVWQAEDGELVAELEDVDDGRGVALSLSPDGGTLAAGSSTGTVKLWELATGTLLHTLEGHGGEVSRALWTPDGRDLVTVAGDGDVVVWNPETGAERRRWHAHDSAVHGAALSPDAARLATASADRTVRVWDLATGERLGELRGHAERVWDVAWSPDGRTLASVSNDYTLRLWNPETGRPLAVRRYPIQVYLTRWSPDGRTLLVAPFSGELDLLTAPAAGGGGAGPGDT